MHMESRPLTELRRSYPSVEKWMGASFSIIMSGVFSRMIRDPSGERYHAIMEMLGSTLFVPSLMVSAVAVILVYYYGDRFGLWIPQVHQYYVTMAGCAAALYLGGYVFVDNMAVGAAVLFFSGGLLAVLALKKDEWGIGEPRMLRRISGSG